VQDFLKNRPRVGSSGNRRQAGHPAATGTGSGDGPVFDPALLGAVHATGGGSGPHEVSVEAIKEGDRVTKLVVTCKCGERIEILCAYTPGQR
jgi:hypothetical protein